MRLSSSLAGSTSGFWSAPVGGEFAFDGFLQNLLAQFFEQDLLTWLSSMFQLNIFFFYSSENGLRIESCSIFARATGISSGNRCFGFYLSFDATFYLLLEQVE
jgi:hypothetical protein